MQAEMKKWKLSRKSSCEMRLICFSGRLPVTIKQQESDFANNLGWLHFMYSFCALDDAHLGMMSDF